MKQGLRLIAHSRCHPVIKREICQRRPPPSPTEQKMISRNTRQNGTMISKKYSNSIMLALLSQNPAANGISSQEVIESAAASFHLRHKPNGHTHGKECYFSPRRSKVFNRRMQLGGNRRKKSTVEPDIGILSLSVPSPKEIHFYDFRHNGKGRYHKNGNVDNEVVADPDVGILSSSKASSSCPSTNEMCQADSTSSLGGRCVSDMRFRSSFHQAIHRKNRLLQPAAPYETDILPTQSPAGSVTPGSSGGLVSINE